jgi:spermidine/putrescine transport system substrate-binding protein
MNRKTFIVISISLYLPAFVFMNTAMAEQKVLNILTWAGYNEDRIIKPFEEKYNCKVNSKNFSGDEQMLTIWSASKPGTWDVVNPDGPWVKLLAAQGKIMKLDAAKYPLDDLFPIFQRFPQHWEGNTLWGVASRWGFYGIAYNTKYVTKEEVKSWKVMWDPKYKGKVGIYGWYLPNMGNFGRYLGFESPYDIDMDQLKQLEKTLLELKPQVATITLTASELIQALANESVWMAPAGNWAAVTLKEQGLPIEHFVPDEGAVSWTESLCITSDSKNPDLAEKFLQWMLSPEIQAKLAWAEAFHAATPSRKAAQFLKKEQAEILRMTDAGVDIVKRVSPRKLPKDEEAWKDVWLKFKGE